MLGLPLGGSSTPELYHGKYVAGMFGSGEQGLWCDPSDKSTLFQDAAGTIPVTAVEQPVGKMLDKSGRGNHATQVTSANRPVFSARYNQLANTTTLSTQNVTTRAASYVLSFSGAGTVTLSGTAAGTFSSGSNTFTATAGTLTATVAGSVTNASLVPSIQAAMPYQRVGNVSVTASDYDADPTKFRPYLRFNGAGMFMVTGNVNFSTTSALSMWFGCYLHNIFSYSTVAAQNYPNTYSWYAIPKTTRYDTEFGRKGSGNLQYTSSVVLTFPLSAVFTWQFDLSKSIELITQKINGIQAWNGQQGGDSGTGPLANTPIYIGQTGNSANWFNGNLYSLIIRGAATDDAHLTHTEKFIAYKTGVNL